MAGLVAACCATCGGRHCGPNARGKNLKAGRIPKVNAATASPSSTAASVGLIRIILPMLAYGCMVLAEHADLLYKATGDHAPEHDRSIAWDNPLLAIDWPLHRATPKLAARD